MSYIFTLSFFFLFHYYYFVYFLAPVANCVCHVWNYRIIKYVFCPSKCKTSYLIRFISINMYLYMEWSLFVLHWPRHALFHTFPYHMEFTNWSAMEQATHFIFIFTYISFFEEKVFHYIYIYIYTYLYVELTCLCVVTPQALHRSSYVCVWGSSPSDEISTMLPLSECNNDIMLCKVNVAVYVALVSRWPENWGHSYCVLIATRKFTIFIFELCLSVAPEGSQTDK